MAVTVSQIAPLLLPGLRAVNGYYASMQTQWARVFATGKSNMNTERTAQVRFLSLPELKVSGAPTSFDMNSGTRWTYNHTHVAFGLGYAFTREALDDNLYKSAFNPANLGLADSFKQMKEIQAAAVLNSGNVVTPGLGGDNQPLFSTTHPVDGYSVPNTPTVQIGLNENAMTLGANLARRFRDDAGLLKPGQARTLVVPTQLRHQAKRLTETQLRPGTTDNDIWAVKENNDYSNGYVVMDFLTSDYAWFLLTDLGGLIHLERTPFETSMQTDFVTDNLQVKAYERYYFGYDDWRAAVGFYPTN